MTQTKHLLLTEEEARWLENIIGDMVETFNDEVGRRINAKVNVVIYAFMAEKENPELQDWQIAHNKLVQLYNAGEIDWDEFAKRMKDEAGIDIEDEPNPSDGQDDTHGEHYPVA